MGSLEPGTRSKIPDDVRKVFEEYDIDNGKFTKPKLWSKADFDQD